MKKKDLILILSIVLVIGIAFFANKILNSKNGSKVEIYIGNKLYRTVPLNKTENIKIDNEFGKNEIRIYNNGVEIHSADCPDKVCVNTGFINKPNQSIVCLPHKLSVKIVGENDGETNDVDVK